MKRIWAPWRMAYINSESKEVGCLFCLQLTKEDGPGNLIIHRGKHAYVILNRYPYTNGHLMVVPFAHEASLEGLNDDTRSELMQLTNHALGVLRQVSGAQAFNIGINIGEAAGAGITDHVHVHIVPRWAGDTNFMSSIGETRVLPEALEETYKKLLAGWRELNLNP